MLEHALAWAARGFKVFPLQAGGKTPIWGGFSAIATTDVDTITAWWRDPLTGSDRDYNVGVLTNDYVVVDIDTKRGKPGLDTYYGLGGHFDTLTVATPSGGYHAYFVGPDSSLSSVWGKLGVDIRSHGGYVIAPGSVITGACDPRDIPGRYSLSVDADLAWVPPDIEARLKPPGVRTERPSDVDLDTATAIANATVWLENNAPIAIEGAGGDSVTYQVAATLVRDYALSEETAFHLMIHHWNESCIPSWDHDELYSKVENAYQYGTREIGIARTENIFGNVNIPDVPKEIDFTNTYGFGNAREPAGLPPRPWLIRRLLMRQHVTVLPAAGSTGKSALSLAIAAHGALGLDIGPFKTVAPFKSIVYNAEDDLVEQSRRLLAICVEYGFEYDKVRENIILLSSDDVQLTVAQTIQRQVQVYEPHVAQLIGMASDPSVGLVVLDPLVELHGCNESDNVEMKSVMGIIRRIARESNTAILTPHHTSKPGTGAQQRAGNADISRGASAIVNSPRVVMTLVNATDEDRATFGITEDDKHKFVRLDDAKANITLASPHSTWFKRVGVRLYNGDEVGVLKLVEMSINEENQKLFFARTCLELMSIRNSASVTMADAVIAIQASDPLYERMNATIVRGKLERALRSGVQLEQGEVACIREPSSAGDKLLITIR